MLIFKIAVIIYTAWFVEIMESMQTQYNRGGAASVITEHPGYPAPPLGRPVAPGGPSGHLDVDCVRREHEADVSRNDGDLHVHLDHPVRRHDPQQQEQRQRDPCRRRVTRSSRTGSGCGVSHGHHGLGLGVGCHTVNTGLSWVWGISVFFFCRQFLAVFDSFDLKQTVKLKVWLTKL